MAEPQQPYDEIPQQPYEIPQQPSGVPDSEFSGGSQVSASVVGPAFCPTATIVRGMLSSAKITLDTVIKHISITPQINKKGSFNIGDNLSKPSSKCCGKPAPCGGCSKKSKSCGGGGGGCGGKKKKKQCDKKKYRVIYKDFYERILKTIYLIDGADGESVAPWKAGQEHIEKEDGGVYKWNDKWATEDGDTEAIKNVKEDLTVTAQFEKISPPEPYQQEYAKNEENPITTVMTSCMNKYRNCVFKCFDLVSKVEETISGYPTAAMEQYEISQEEYPKTYEGIMNILPQYARPDNLEESLCTDWEVFNDAKKGLLNLQSSITFRMRMMLNVTLDPIFDMINDNWEYYSDRAEEGIDITKDLNDLNEEISIQIEDCLVDITDMWNEYREGYNKYLKDIKYCFSVDIPELTEI